MLLYLVNGEFTFGLVQPINQALWRARGGMPVAEPWEIIEFTRLGEAADEPPRVDCLTMNTGADGFLISEKAKHFLKPMLETAGQLWPVRVNSIPYWWFNCSIVINGLDHNKIDVDWSLVQGSWGYLKWISTTRLLYFKRYEVTRAPALFRVPEYPQGALFAQEVLRLAVQEHGLTGFKFDPVWSSERGGVLNPPGLSFGSMFDQDSSGRKRSNDDGLFPRTT